jgi:tetratricopeptide (TPR) repeat protein
MKALITYCHANIHAKSESGVTPLIVALASGNDDNATFLVENGNSEDKSVILAGNVTTYHIAADMNLPNALRALLSNNDDNNNTSEPLYRMKNDRNETPMDLAVLCDNVKCVVLLLSKDHLGCSNEAEALLFMEQRKKELKDRKQVEKGDDSKKINELEEKNQGHGNKPNEVKDITDIEDRAKGDVEHISKLVVTEEQKNTGLQHKKLGNELFAKRCFADAVREYTMAIDADPTDVVYYSNRSASYMSLKRYNEALYDAVICRYLKPDWVKGCYRLSVAHLALGKYEDAAVSAWEGMQLDNDNEELKCLLQKAVKQGNKVHGEKNAKMKSSDSSEIDDISNS